jgi:alpha-L-fucosidase 2
MKSAAEFYVGFLVPDPRRMGTNVWLVTNPSYSPEHGADCAGPTMDNALLRNLFGNVMAAGKALGVDPEFRAKLASLRAKLPPNQIGSFGQLQEWLEDIDKEKEQHRHMSPLFGLFPGNEISPLYTPELAGAAEISMNARGDAPNNNGWSKAWKMCLRDRLLEGEHAYLIFTNLLSRDVQGNMMFMRSNIQIDGTFGATAGIGEMLLQSQAGEISMLPALPWAWAKGEVKGLRARGGFEVAMQWKERDVTVATIHSDLGKLCRVRTRWPFAVKHDGKEVKVREVSAGVVEWPTVAGGEYELKF